MAKSISTFPKFNSLQLQKSVEGNFERFKAFQDSLNRISADIQTLEKFLKECGLNVTYVWFSEEWHDDCRLALAWERVSENQDFRLTVRKYFYDHSDHAELVNADNIKPLISESSEIRRLLWAHLPTFVEKLSKEALGPVEKLIQNDDCPF